MGASLNIPAQALARDWERLQNIFHGYGEGTARPLLVAFSGGLDSRFTAFAARAAIGNGMTNDNPVLVHVIGPHIPGEESVLARQWAEDRSFMLYVAKVNPLALPALARGDRDRCYHCKRAMIEAVFKIGATVFAGQAFGVCDGTNASDYGTYRPGLRALRELGVHSPLAEAGLSKARLRRLADSMGLDRPEQQARPCLLTRLEYGLAPTVDLLRRVEQAERCAVRAMEELGIHTETGLPDFRVRVGSNGSMSLHVDMERNESPALKQRFNTLLEAVIPLMEPVNVVTGKPVSGYFDRTASDSFRTT